MKPKISVIIPCYNQGQYIDEAVQSVLNQTFQNFEIIIINDGSTDDFTNKLLHAYQKPKTKVLHTENKGVSAARNKGILAAEGEYILPLDADDKIGATYLEKAIKILDANSEIGIVYCEAELFGNKNQKWNLPEYKFPDVLVDSFIFCSGVFRKSDWKKVGGYKEEMAEGWEDWEFWISLIESNAKVYKIPEILFYYRQHENLRTKQSKEHQIILRKKIMKFHSNLYIDNLEQIIIPLCRTIAKFTPKEKYLFRVNSKIGKKYRLNMIVEKI